MGIIKRIHVNQHNIRANAKAGNEAMPVFTIKTSKGNTTADNVTIDGPSQLVYQAEDPLSCGAKCWIETKARVTYAMGATKGEIA